MEIIGFEDYVDRIQKEYPEVEKSSISQILRYGTGKILHYKKHDIDLYLSDDHRLKYYMFIGDITTDPYKRMGIYLKKKRRKLRHMAILDKVGYSGYYYFGLTDEVNEKFKETGIIERVSYHKLQDEIYLNPTLKHFYKVKMEDQNKWTLIRENYEECNAEHL